MNLYVQDSKKFTYLQYVTFLGAYFLSLTICLHYQSVAMKNREHNDQLKKNRMEFQRNKRTELHLTDDFNDHSYIGLNGNKTTITCNVPLFTYIHSCINVNTINMFASKIVMVEWFIFIICLNVVDHPT